MFIALCIIFGVVLYIVMSGATHGYSKYRWPPKMEKRYQGYGAYADVDANSTNRGFATIFWPFYWVFIWPFTKTNDVTFTHIEKEAARQVAKNKARVADLQATRAQLEASNAELEAAEVEVEKEMAKL